MDPMFWIWLALLGVFIVVEAATVALVCIWFIAGAAVALIFALCGLPLWSQIAAFVVVSAALLVCLRPFLKKYINSKKTDTNVDALIGKRAVVIDPIDNLQGRGAVKVGGAVWTARSANEAPIAKDTVVIIRKVEGVKAFVEPENN